MISLIESYSEIIESYEIRRYRQYGGAYEFVGTVRFIDDSVLHFRDYFFLNGQRKYSFHWQNNRNQLIIRWDNSPYHKDIETFPFHKHTGRGIEEFESEEAWSVELKKRIERYERGLSKTKSWEEVKKNARELIGK